MPYQRELLRELCPWPTTKPHVPPTDHGWFQAGNRVLLAHHLSPATRLVVELGSWCGQSTKFLLDHAPNADVVAIDHWYGGPEHHVLEDPEIRRLLPILYETFVVNLWDYRERLFPLRTSTLDGMSRLAARGLAPDLLYVDAGHATDVVYADLVAARYFFPKAVLVGDDWLWDTVRAAVEQFAAEKTLRVTIDQNAWVLGNT